MKVLVFVEVDVVVRHFIHSGAFSDLVDRHDVVFVFPELGHKRLGPIDPGRLELGRARRLTLPSCMPRLVLWRWLFFVEMIRSRRAVEDKQLASLRRIFLAGNGWRNYLLYRALGLPVVFPVFKALVNRLLAGRPNEKLDELIRQEAPDVLVHPSVLEGMYINDLVDVSQRTRVPLAVAMNSWDNPASKRAVVGSDYWLLVWGPQTHDHAVRYMGMSPERVIEFGAAQFDIYALPPLISRDKLLAAHGIDPKLAVLLYAGSSKQTDEFVHMQRVDQAIEDGMLPPMAVIYRPHPWGSGGKDGGRFLSHPWKHVFIEIGMRGYLERVHAGDDSKDLPDYADTRDLLSAIDAVVSPLSTILIEAMLLGKAPMCFLPTEEPDARHFRLAQGQVQFDDLFAIPELVVTEGGDNLIAGVAEVMRRAADPSLAAKLKERSRFFVRHFDQPFRQRIVPFLESLTPPAPCV